jgi:membrane protein YqaA with SNARE-associated domain
MSEPLASFPASLQDRPVEPPATYKPPPASETLWYERGRLEAATGWAIFFGWFGVVAAVLCMAAGVLALIQGRLELAAVLAGVTIFGSLGAGAVVLGRAARVWLESTNPADRR